MMRKKSPKGYRHDERIVELTSVATIFSAETIVAALHANGINAMIAGDDAGGMRPALGFSTGYRVMVLENDAEAARDLLGTGDGSVEQ